MSEENKKQNEELSAEDLKQVAGGATQDVKAGELSEKELAKASGGASDYYLKIAGIKGESEAEAYIIKPKI